MLMVLLFSIFLILISYGTIFLYLLIDVNVDYILYILTVLLICFFSLMRLVEHLSALPLPSST